MNATEQPAAPSRNPWPVAIVAWFIVFGGFIAAFTVFAARQRMDLVSRDYYEQELQFQNRIDRLNRTVPFAGQVAVDYSAARRTVRVTLPAGHARRPVTGQIRLYRPADARSDQVVRLHLDPAGAQAVEVGRLPAGLWKIAVDWTVDGQDYGIDRSLVFAARAP